VFPLTLLHVERPTINIVNKNLRG